MKIGMTPRERVRAALEHREVDRTPIDLGGTPNSTMCGGAYANLKAFLGVEAPGRLLSRGFNIVVMDEAVLARLAVDTRAVFANAPARSKGRWLDDNTFVGDWGITYRRPEAWSQFDMIAHPLAEATIDDLEPYDWPDVDDEGRYAGLRDRARDLHENTDFALVGSTGDSTIFDTAWMLRGMEQFLTDLLLDPEFARALMERIAQLQMRRHERFLEQVGQYIDVVMISDDMGTQNGLLISPRLYREMVKPLHRQYVRLVKEHTDAKVAVHACGSIVDLVEDYVEIGVDVLNPMQVAAANMSPQVLKERFGGRMAFWGGIDTQDLLPRGSPGEVRQAVRDTIRTMGLSEGGYILGAVHNVQDDVPPENVWAMLDEAASITASDGEVAGP
jgi:uroporphyrinogen decarboxylase